MSAASETLNKAAKATEDIRVHVQTALNTLNRDRDVNGYGILSRPDFYRMSLGAAIDELSKGLAIARTAHFPTDAEYDAVQDDACDDEGGAA